MYDNIDPITHQAKGLISIFYTLMPQMIPFIEIIRFNLNYGSNIVDD